MKQEDKELLFKDLAARLPYGVKVTWDGKHPLTVTPHIYCAIASEDNINNLPKLLLRPMSSMTDKEREIVCSMNELSNMELNDRIKFCSTYMQNYTIETFDYLNSIHIDYRGLIEKGLALEAPKGMYELK